MTAGKSSPFSTMGSDSGPGPRSYLSPLHFIGAEWLPGGDGTAGKASNPATHEVLADVPRTINQDPDDALAAAHKAFTPWRRIPAVDRSNILKRLSAASRKVISAVKAATNAAMNAATIAATIAAVKARLPSCARSMCTTRDAVALKNRLRFHVVISVTRQ